MLSKNEVKYIQSLCHKRQRDTHGVFVAEGPKLVQELLLAPVVIVHIYALREWIQATNASTLNITEISESELEKISQLQTPNQVLAIAKQIIPTEPPETTNNFIIALDGIQDPGNMGTILRIADWFAIDQVVCSPDCADIFSSKVVQSTMGSIIRVRVWYRQLDEWLAHVNVPVYGALLNGSNVYAANKLTEGILLIGNESKGIRSNIIDMVTHPITIPKMGSAESLNAAVATGIILSHLLGK